MADVPYDYRFVSNTNHPNTPDSDLSHIHPLTIHHYSPYQPIREPIRHVDYAGSHRLAHNDPPFVPTLQFRLPLLPQTLHLTSDYQTGGPAIGSTVPSWLRTRYDDQPTGAHVAQPPVSATLSVPFSVPLTLPVAVPFTLPLPSGCRSPIAVDPNAWDGFPTAQQLEDSIPKTETPPLHLQDICHLEPATYDDLPYPPPIIACNSPDILAPPRSFDGSHKIAPSASAATLPMPPWSPPSPIPSLSYGSPSGSENSSILSAKELTWDGGLRLSLSPPPFTSKLDEDGLGSSPTLGIIVDVNMREQALMERSPTFCVNPADIMAGFVRSSGPSPETSPNLDDDEDFAAVLHSTPVLGVVIRTAVAPTPAEIPTTSARPLSPVQDYSVDFPDEAVIDQDFPQETISAIVSVLRSSSGPLTSEEAPPSDDARPESAAASLQSEAFAKTCEVVAPRPVYAQSGHIYPGNDLGMLRPGLVNPSGGSGVVAYSNSSRNGGRVPLGEIHAPQLQYSYTTPSYVPQLPQALPSAPAYPFPLPPAAQQAHAPAVDSNALQPVLNAHVGIPLDELRQRAAEYRARHPNAELDKAFLQSFAGRLSARGELIDDYRCYVVGCGQRNKRRDHILVHVGSHVEHRPWACQHCGMRFLRKNECKRHESSHEGRKPYSCQICAPLQDRSFVRQDLLKRHMRVSHGVHDTARRKSQSKKGEERWP